MAQQSIIASGASFSIGLGEGVTNLAIGLSGTFGSGNFTFEASCDGGATWDPTDATRSVGAVVESVTGVLTGPAAPAYSWDVSVGGYTHFRMRCTALASGTALIDIRRENLGSGSTPLTLGQHEEILERITARDPAGARTAMAAHLEGVAAWWRTHVTAASGETGAA